MSLKQILRSLFVFGLAMLVFISSTSFALTMHFCSSKLVSYSTSNNTKTCCIDSKSKLFENPDIAKLFVSKSFSCCKNKIIKKDSKEDILTSISSINIQLQSLILLLPQLNFIVKDYSQYNQVNTFAAGFEDLSFKEHLPSTNILHQVFII